MTASSDSRGNVIGLCSTGHGAAIALASARHGVRALTLDRFTGHKHSLLFTRRERDEIRRGATPIDRQINEALSYSYDGFPRAHVIEETFLPFLHAVLRGLPLTPRDIDLVVTSDCHFGFNSGRVGGLLRSFFPNAEVVRSLEHHAIHQWQAFLPSPFAAAAVLTADESGEALDRLGGRKVAMTLAVARGTAMEVVHEHTHPRSSPGLLYADVSRHLGYHAGEEGKTMGLAAFGGDCVYRALAPHLTLHRDGSFDFMDTPELLARLARWSPRRERRDPVLPVHADIAHGVQRLLEDIMGNAMRALEAATPPDIEAVCLAGGVALNSCANERIFRASRFKDIYVCPNAGDDGHALACALYGARMLRGLAMPRGMAHDYLGPARGDDALRAEVAARGLEVIEATPDAVAALLAEGRIVGLYQGGAEFGPRALGNRSILADPRPAGMAVQVNARVKHRELYRPYAPVVLEEKVHEWFEMRGRSPYMLRVVPVRPDRRARVPAITHIDGTARVQTIGRADNPRLYDIVAAFERRTGIPVIMNTSFNLAGKPVVETLDDALDCYRVTGIDALVIGPCLLVKPEEERAHAPPSPAAMAAEMTELREYEVLCDHARALEPAA
ncbi:carbamoyltransferase family protein [Azospirillum argentinense]